MAFISRRTSSVTQTTDILLYLKRTRIRRRHLIDDETYWSARYVIEIPLDGFEKQGGKKSEKMNEER